MGEHDGHRDRLRKRFLEQGMDVLQDDQVLELLLFYALPRRDTNDLARKLLKHFGSIAAVLEAPLQELKAAGGVGESRPRCCSTSSRPLARRYLLSRGETGTVVLTSTQACGEYLLPYFLRRHRGAGVSPVPGRPLPRAGTCRLACSAAASTPPPSPCARWPRAAIASQGHHRRPGAQPHQRRCPPLPGRLWRPLTHGAHHPGCPWTSSLADHIIVAGQRLRLHG